MQADLLTFENSIQELSRGELVRRLVEEHTALTALRSKEREWDRQSTQMTRDYKSLEEDLKKARAELEESRALCEKLRSQNALLTKERFGRSCETSDSLMGGDSAEDAADPLSEDAAPSDSRTVSFDEAARRYAGNVKASEGKKRKKRIGKREDDLSGMRQVYSYVVDPGGLDELYGADGWMIVGWENHRHVQHAPGYNYVMNTCVPAVKILTDGKLVKMPCPDEFFRRSLASPSVLWDIFYKRYVLYLPVYRISADYTSNFFPLTRQTVTNWILNYVPLFFGPVYDRLCELLGRVTYQQCDETTWMVINDGRKAGSKSYIWAHMTSEFCEGPKIVVFCYERTRGTDHLRKFFPKEFSGTICADAYQAYLTFARERDGLVTISLCWMHCRRRIAEALSLLHLKDKAKRELDQLPEVRAIRMIAAVYRAENKLRTLSADERNRLRNKTVRRLVDQFYNYMEELNQDLSSLSGKMKDAVQYAVEHRDGLYRFLDDGAIPIDNGYAERNIKSIVLARRACLFSTSVDGAKANTIMSSIAQTAIRNGADPRLYIGFLLEAMPDYMDETDRSVLDRLMPWGDAFREYTEKKKDEVLHPTVPESEERPRFENPGRRKRRSA